MPSWDDDGSMTESGKDEAVLMRMLRLGRGPGIELFERRTGSPVPQSDFGLQHVALYVDDIGAAAARFVEAGGVLLCKPAARLGVEEGDGNFFCYGRLPWGTTIELVSLPDRTGFEDLHAEPRYVPPLA